VHPPAAYAAGGDDKILELRQGNGLVDNDVLTDGSGAGIAPADHREALKDALAEARDEVPEDLRVPQGDASDALSFLLDRDAGRVGGSDAHPHEAAAGRYVDGAPSDAPVPWRTDEETPAPTGGAKTATDEVRDDWPVGQEAATGGNEAANAAVIVDANETAASLIVLGDYFSTNAVVQVNVLQDRDDVTFDNGSGVRTAPGLPKALTGGNEAVNVADLDVREVSFTASDRGPGPVQWNVEIVQGDYFDVKSLRQVNTLVDNDVTSQTSTDVYSMVSTGGNLQANLARFYDLSKTYDVIVVCGDYHKANLIFQTNILLDDDVLELYAEDRGGVGAAVAQQARSGENLLVNEAVIREVGGTRFQEMSAEIEALVAAMREQSAQLDPSLAWQLLGGSGTIDVLFVTGDYYDLNLISQVNVVADMDLAIQTSPAGGVINADKVAQTITTGLNQLVNSAAIVDVGTLTGHQYLGGDEYEDTILIQAEILRDQDGVIYGDAGALAPEVVAFAGEDGAAPGDDLPPPFMTTTIQVDVLGSVLS
jgi:hypothetical protein